MPITSWMLTLSSSEQKTQALLDWLHADERLTIGEQREQYLPLVGDFASTRDESDWLKACKASPGLMLIDLVYADFSDLVEDPKTPSSGER